MGKRIFLLINTLKYGGAERIVADLSVFLEKHGHEVHILLMDHRDIAYKYGGIVHKLTYFRKISLLVTLQNIIMTLFYNLKLRPDITISHMEYFNCVNMISSVFGKKIPVFHNYMIESQRDPTFRNRLMDKIVRWRHKDIYKAIVVSKEMIGKMSENYKIPCEKIKCIYNAFDIDGITKKAGERIFKRDTPFMNDKTFINVSRFVEQKSLHKLVLAFSRLILNFPDANLVFIGDGPDRKKLQELINAMGMQENVLITGFIENPYKLVAHARAFVFSSYYEGFGNVLVEAMSAGACVISTDCKSGPREIIAPNTTGITDGVELCEYGILTTPPDGEWTTEIDKVVMDLQKAMELVISDETLCDKYKKQSLKRAQDFKYECMYPDWLEIINE